MTHALSGLVARGRIEFQGGSWAFGLLPLQGALYCVMDLDGSLPHCSNVDYEFGLRPPREVSRETFETGARLEAFGEAWRVEKSPPP